MVQGGDGPNYFLLQRVGLQTDGALMPRSPLSPNARQCLTVIGQDDLSGNGLEMKPCQDPNIAADPTTKISNSLREAQKFSLEMDGRIRSKVTGLCIRRMDCDGRKMFDVGKCDTQQVATFVVKKAQMNHLDHLSQMGFPSSAVAAEQCEICGAYMLTYRCRGMMMPGGRSLCIKGFHSKPGWTNMPSQSIPGDMFDLTGRKTKAKGEELGNMEAAGEVAGSVQDVDMSGMGQRMAKINGKADFSYEDGLTILERRQRKNQGEFLTGSAKSQADKDSIVGEIDAPDFGGLDQDRFQLLFITVFGLLTLVGSLSG